MEEIRIVNGKGYRYGHTTGSCAAAAARAAASMLFGGENPAAVRIYIPAGRYLDLPVEAITRTDNGVSCGVRKDGGDDPDVTTGLLVMALAEYAAEPGVELRAGEGIGIATRPGLKVPVGEPAINPVPRAMIRREVEAVLPAGRGVKVTISIPGGEAVARRTFNSRLGIVGGLSVLGTTGLVKPMSEEAWKDALALELHVVAQTGATKAAFAFGNYGERFAEERLGTTWPTVTMGNFVGHMLEKAVAEGFKEILMVGHIGKLIKVAGGIFHTHSRVADARLELMVAFAALAGADTATCQSLMGCLSTEEACGLIEAAKLPKCYAAICEAVTRRCQQHVRDGIAVGTVLYRGENQLLAMDASAKGMVTAVSAEGGLGGEI